MPGRYYSLINEDAQFWGIDSERWDKDQQEYLDAELGASKAVWKIVYGHHPMYSSGGHGDTWTMHGTLGKMLKRHKVDLYLAGHDHHLEYQERDGVGHAISGAAAKVRSVRDRDHFTYEGLGFAHISFAEKPCLTLRFADERGRLLYQTQTCKPGATTRE